MSQRRCFGAARKRGKLLCPTIGRCPTIGVIVGQRPAPFPAITQYCCPTIGLKYGRLGALRLIAECELRRLLAFAFLKAREAGNSSAAAPHPDPLPGVPGRGSKTLASSPRHSDSPQELTALAGSVPFPSSPANEFPRSAISDLDRRPTRAPCHRGRRGSLA